MKNFHIPLPDQTYDDLKAAARRSKLPATARPGGDWFLVTRRAA